MTKNIEKLLTSLYSGNTDDANKALNKALDQKKEEVLTIKKVAVASEIFNKG